MQHLFITERQKPGEGLARVGGKSILRHQRTVLVILPNQRLGLGAVRGELHFPCRSREAFRGRFLPCALLLNVQPPVIRAGDKMGDGEAQRDAGRIAQTRPDGGVTVQRDIFRQGTGHFRFWGGLAVLAIAAPAKDTLDFLDVL